MNIVNGKYKIRNATAKDARILCVWWNDGAIMAHAGFPNGLGTTIQKIQESLGKDSDETTRRHIIESDGLPIGEMNYRNIGNKTAEVGIKICNFNEQNKGHGTVILSMFIECLFKDYQYETIVLDTNLSNLRAQHFYEKKLGFKKIAVNMNAWRDQMGVEQSSIDYEMKKDDWKNNHVNYVTIYE